MDIRHKFTQQVIFNVDSETLRGADLRRADLRGAKIKEGTELFGHRPLLQIGPVGSAQRTLFAWVTNNGLILQTGCFLGNEFDFINNLNHDHADDIHRTEYMAALELARVHYRLWSTKQ